MLQVNKWPKCLAVVVAQLTTRSLLIPEDPGSNPVISNLPEMPIISQGRNVLAKNIAFTFASMGTYISGTNFLHYSVYEEPIT